MARYGVPAGGLIRVGQVVGTNLLRFHRTDDALTVALTLLSAHVTGAPVVDEEARCVGFVSEHDVFQALNAGRDLGALAVQDIMTRKPLTVTGATTIEEAASIMQETRFANLPVERDGRVVYSLTRHDVLRAWLGLGLGGEA